MPTLFQPRPPLACGNAIYDRVGYTKLGCDLAMRYSVCQQLSDVSNIIMGQFTRAIPAALCHRITSIVRDGAKPKVGRIAAWRVVTCMTHKHSRWDRPLIQFIRHSMSRNRATHSRPAKDLPITISSPTSSPAPAFSFGAGLYHVSKAFSEGALI